MSLYNALFGQNPFSGVLLQMLGTTSDAVPRYRDCYLSEDGSQIVIHTRTGGGNRDFYENERRCRKNYPEYFSEAESPSGPWNDDLRKLPGFAYDEDDEFDCTYADFYFDVPEAFAGQIALLKELGAVQNPGERWQQLLDGLRNKDTSDPTVARALAVGEQIFAQINAATKPT